MALATGTEFTITSTATTGNVNGAGFNPANANMLTDLTTDANTANTASPVVSSASYNFVAGDVGNWVYIKSGTNWIPGWYQIASVASNKATLTASIGSAQVVSNSFKAPSTVVGCATVGTPTGGTFTIDYSQTDTAVISARTDFGATGSSTSLTSATGGFTPVMVGNFYGQRTTGTGAFGVVGWYEIVSYTNATTLVLDRTPNSGTASVGCTGYIGGAGRFNALEDSFTEMAPAGAHVWVKNGTYTVSGSVSTASANATSTDPIWYIGFNSIPGDDPRSTNRPTLAMGANGFTAAAYNFFSNLIFTGTSSTLFAAAATNGFARYCKFFNTSSSTARAAAGGNSNTWQACEFISQNGNGGTFNAGTVYGCYFHDSTNGISSAANVLRVFNCLFANNLTSGITSTSTSGLNQIMNNTFYGRSSAPMGTAFNCTVAGVQHRFYNNIFSSFATGILFTTTNSMSNLGGYNNFYNNTTDATLFTKDSTDIALNPSFTDISEITFSTGTITGGTTTLTVSGADFSAVEDNVDFCRITSVSGGTGTFVGNYLITSHTTTTLTFNNAAGTSGSATSVTGYVTTGHNYGVGTNMKAAANPGIFVGSDTTSYLDTGAVQRQEPASSGGSFSYTFS